MLKLFSKLDLFGVPITQSFDNKSPYYQSAIGGITTLIICITSIVYALYVFIQRVNGSMTPSATSTNYISNFTHLYQQDSLVKISSWKVNNTTIDPFLPIGNILTPLLVRTTLNNTFVNAVSLLDDDVDEFNEYGGVEVDSHLKFEFDLNEATNLQQLKYVYYIIIAQCNIKYLKQNQTCASPDVINKYWSQPANTVLLDYYFEAIKPSSKNRLPMVERIYANIEQTVCYLQVSYLKSTYYQIYDFLFYGSAFKQELIDEQRLQTQTQTMDYCRKYLFGIEFYIGVYIQFTNLQSMNEITYASIGQILAEIGSIISCLFLVKYAIIFLNNELLTEKMVHQLLEFYYPEIKTLKVERKWYGSVKSVKFKGKDIETKNYTRFMKQANEIMSSKLTFKNIIYELSRIEFILRSMQSRNLLRQCHNIGIKLDFDQFKEKRRKGRSNCLIPQKIDNISPNYIVLTDEDCELFSYRTSHEYHNLILNDPGPQAFYEINQMNSEENRQAEIPPDTFINIPPNSNHFRQGTMFPMSP